MTIKVNFIFIFTFLKKNSNSFLSLMSSCKDFLYNLSKDLIVCSSFSFIYLYLMFLIMINLCNTLLPNDKAHGIPADIGKIIKPTPVFDEGMEIDVAPMIIILSTDSNTVFRVL